MKTTGLRSGLILAIGLGASVGASAASAPDDKVLATVNGEPIRLESLRASLAAGPSDPAKILDRLINVELILQEASRMGLAETLEVKDQLGIFERDTLRDGLFAKRLSGVKPTPAEVDALAKAMTTEVRMRSAMFKNRADAAKLSERAGKGEDFDAVAEQLTGGGKGTIDPGEGFIKVAELRPEVQGAITRLSPGAVSPPYAIEDRFAVTKLVDRKSVADPEARSKAEVEALKRAQTKVMIAYVDELKAKYAKVDDAALKAADFDAPTPGFDAYLTDKRPIVAIQGEAPITAADLAGAVRKRLFHGAEQAAEKGRLNQKKVEVLDDLVSKRVVMKEARRLGLDRTPEYLAVKSKVEEELVFGAFVAKVLEPETKATNDEIRRYYEAHKKEYTGPDMVRLDSLAFADRASAEAAFRKLRAGADLTWMRANAAGRLDPAAVPEDLRVPPAPLMLGGIPEDIRKALEGAKSGEYRLYASPRGTSLVLLVRENLSGQAKPLEDVSGEIRRKLAGDKRQKAFDDYAATLRKASEVKVLVTPAELKAMTGDVAKKTS